MRFPSTSLGPVHPFGEISTIIGQRARSVVPPDLAACWMARISSRERSQGRRHGPVHRHGLVPFDDVWGPAVAAQQLVQFGAGNSREQRGIGDLVPVEVQNRQHRAIRRRIQKLVGVPGGRQRPGLGLAVAHDAGHRQGGLSNTAPNAWLSEYPSSPPSWIEPGHSAEAWLGTPPGNENCVNNRLSPASSSLILA